MAFSTESLCERYLRSPAARAFAPSLEADRRRTLRGWHLPPTLYRCILTDSRIPSLAGLHVEGAPLVFARTARMREHSQCRAGPRLRAEIRLATSSVLSRPAVDAAHRALEPTPRMNHSPTRSRGGLLRRDVVPGLSPGRDHGIELLWCLSLSRATDAQAHRAPARPSDAASSKDTPTIEPRHLKPPEPQEHRV